MKGAAPRRRPPEPNWPRRRQKVLLPIQTSKRHTGGPRPPRALILGDPVLLGLSFWGTLPSSGSHSVPFPDLALTTASGGSVPSGVFLFGSGLGISVSSLENNRQVWGGFAAVCEVCCAPAACGWAEGGSLTGYTSLRDGQECFPSASGRPALGVAASRPELVELLPWPLLVLPRPSLRSADGRVGCPECLRCTRSLPRGLVSSSARGRAGHSCFSPEDRGLET